MKDVRQKGFQNRVDVDEVLNWIDRHVGPLDSEIVDWTGLAGRVLSQDVVSQSHVPNFRRAMMDGFAVDAEDVAGATPLQPIGGKRDRRDTPGAIVRIAGQARERRPNHDGRTDSGRRQRGASF